MSDDIDKPEVLEPDVEASDGKGQTNIIPILGSVEPGKPDKLTGKQSAFVQHCLKGKSLSDAYRASYCAESMSPHAIWTERSRLAAHPVVSRRIEAGRRLQEASATHTAAGLRDHIIRGLYDLTEKADSDNARLRAYELLGKTELVSLFVERTSDVTEDMSPEQVQEALETKLKQAFGE